MIWCEILSSIRTTLQATTRNGGRCTGLLHLLLKDAGTKIAEACYCRVRAEGLEDQQEAAATKLGFVTFLVLFYRNSCPSIVFGKPIAQFLKVQNCHHVSRASSVRVPAYFSDGANAPELTLRC